MTWKAWTEEEVTDLVRSEVARLGSDTRERFRAMQCEPRLLRWKRLAGFGKEEMDEDSTWAIAVAGGHVLFFDSVEEEFGVGQLREDSRLHGASIYGENLAWALNDFPPDQEQEGPSVLFKLRRRGGRCRPGSRITLETQKGVGVFSMIRAKGPILHPRGTPRTQPRSSTVGRRARAVGYPLSSLPRAGQAISSGVQDHPPHVQP